jgi:plasmid replication initiation protein
MPKKKAVVVQANSLVEARYRLSNLEQRLIFSLLSKIEADDDDLREYDIPLKELSQLMGIDLADAYKELAKLTKQLMTRVLTIKSKAGNLLHIHWLCRAEHKPGSVALSFVPDLKPYLLHLKSEFTICELETIAGFGGKYTIRIYMLLRQYASIGWREFELAELREILGIEKKEYPQYKEFSRRVLAQAKKEMDAVDEYGRPKSDLSFEVETIREGRKITRLKFVIVRNKKKPANNSIGKAVSQVTASAVKTNPQPQPIHQNWDFPEHWLEFLEYIEKHDPGMLTIIEQEGPNIRIVKYPYLKWEEKFKR